MFTIHDLLKSLKDPKDIDLKTIRTYEGGEPSATGLLQMIDSYMPTDTSALTRGTFVHKFIEDKLNGNPVDTPDASTEKFIVSILPYMYLYRATDKTQKILLEQKLTVKGVLGGTIDHIRVIGENSAIITDFKTQKKLAKLSPIMELKYNIQLMIYEFLVNKELNLDCLGKELLFISEGGINQQALSSVIHSHINKTTILMLITYYHGLNKTHLDDAVLKIVYDYTMRTGMSLALGEIDSMDIISPAAASIKLTLGEMVNKINHLKDADNNYFNGEQ